jgi:serine/threonine protein kinase
MGNRKIGRYEVISEIGQGAMGVVYRAVDPLIEREVAIKTINLEAAGAGRAEYEQRFYREAKSAGRLSHPNIVTIYDVGNEDDVAYIAMEFLEGLELRKLIDTDRLQTVERIVKIAARAADGLAYAHKNNVVHRDIKPSNIMIMRNGVVKIMDFGIASMPTSSSRTIIGSLMGSPQYMSPEQAESREVDGRSDIFSLGVVLYEMLTGKPPFQGSSMDELLYNIVHLPAMAPSKRKPELPRAFDKIIARVLAKDPNERYQNAADFAHDLRNYETLEPSETLSAALDMDAATVMVVEQFGNKPAPEPVRKSPGAKPFVAAKPKANPKAQKTNRLPLLLGLVGGLLVLVTIALSFMGDAKHPAQEVAAQQPAVVESAPLPVVAAPPVADVGVGMMTLAISPWGEVIVDDKSHGASPPLNQLELPAGKHLVEIRNADFTPHRVEIEVKAGESVSIRHKFR